ncbi:MAG: putative transport system permease protein [Chloroflexota bacterium]|jgi:putative ABC transport system permease protein|nr:putative transport system permease protein [Chloroflexota bacterium]
MSILRTFETGLRGLAGHRLRSVLTTLGILFGVAAVIATVGIGQASSDSVTNRITALGTNLLTVSPGSTVSAGVFGGSGTASTLTMADVTGLASSANAPDVQAVAPVVQARKTLVSSSSNWSTTVNGSSAGWLVTNARTISSGRFLNATDVQTHADVVVLGVTTAQDLGVGVGDSVAIGSAEYQVIGILTQSGGAAFQNGDDVAVVPITTAQDQITGGDPNAVQRILLSANNSSNVGSAYQEATALLNATHHVTDPAAADFTITSQSSFLSTAQAVTNTLTILLASVAAISLLVGGIGVMNIMLVSVTERTSEIGLRQALGATPGDLLRQFLIEAATLSLLGGVLGVGLGLLVGVLLPKLANIAVTITVQPILISVAVAAGVGLVFGVYPALRAARLAPIEALRAQ